METLLKVFQSHQHIRWSTGDRAAQVGGVKGSEQDPELSLGALGSGSCSFRKPPTPLKGLPREPQFLPTCKAAFTQG